MSTAIVATRRVRHVAILVKTHHPGGWLSADWIPLCGSPARTGTAGTTFVWPNSSDRLKKRPLCVQCKARFDELVDSLDAAEAGQ